MQLNCLPWNQSAQFRVHRGFTLHQTQASPPPLSIYYVVLGMDCTCAGRLLRKTTLLKNSGNVLYLKIRAFKISKSHKFFFN